jgi:tol-pal system protein YbgF
MQGLSGKVDEDHYNFDKQLKQLAAEIDVLKSTSVSGASSQKGKVPQNINDRLSRIEADIVFLKAKLSAIEAQKSGMGTAPAPSAASSPEDAYKQAYDLFKDSKYTEARQGMEDFLKQYPDDALAGNAQFWIGECYYQEGQYENAILAYEKVIKKFPTNRKVPAAMLKQGFAFANIGDKDAARSILRDILDKYPGTDLAQAAQKKLDTIK